ncbi:hypothetical protein BDY17DRAFT_237332, partial [Neohortaea acidophila]
FAQLSLRFLSWLTENGTSVSPKIELADLRHRNAGRGVIAKDDIEEDEELFSVPRSTILTSGTSDLPSDIRAASPDDPWLSLILAMIYEYQHGAESRWKPYFDVLPTQFNTLMYWTDDELELLQGSAVVSKIGKDKATETFRTTILPIIRQYEANFACTHLSDGHLLDLCHRMGSSIMAYAFDLESSTNTTSTRNEEDGWEEDSDTEDTLLPKGMVPLADMLNADADRNNAKLFYEDDNVVMKTIKPVRKGEELFNDYGPLPRADVLRRYGYITDNYAKYDVVEISLELVKSIASKELNISPEKVNTRVDYLAEHDVVEDGFDIAGAASEDEHFPPELTVLLNTLALPQADFEILKKKDKLPRPDLSPGASKLLHSVLLQRQARY